MASGESPGGHYRKLSQDASNGFTPPGPISHSSLRRAKARPDITRKRLRMPGAGRVSSPADPCDPPHRGAREGLTTGVRGPILKGGDSEDRASRGAAVKAWPPATACREGSR